MTDLYLFGTNSLSAILTSYIQSDSRYLLRGITVNKEYVDAEEFSGVPLIPFEDLSPNPDSFGIINCVGYSGQMELREAVSQNVMHKGIPLLSYAHLSSIIDGVSFGENNIVMANVTIEPNSVVGNGNVFYGGGYICHNALIGDFNWFSAKCVFAGNVRVGYRNFIGINACVRDGVEIGSMSIIGMGAVVVNDVRSNTIVIGNPAIEREMKAGGIRNG